ncbi:unnamed protein product [Musa acuminata var. zebrina]
MGSAEGTLVRHPLSTAASQRTHARVALSPRRTLLQRPGFACVRASPLTRVSSSATACTRPAPFAFFVGPAEKHGLRPSFDVRAHPLECPATRTQSLAFFAPPSWLLPFTYTPALGTATQRKSPRTGNMFPGNGGWISTWMNQPPLPDLNIYSFSAADVAVPFPFFFLSLSTGRD